MDPLDLLREWMINEKLDSIRLGPERVEFADSYSFRRDAPTSYKSQKGKGEFYALATLLVFLRNRKTPFPQYVKITKQENVPTVSYLDRKDVEAYLTGQSNSSEYIQLAAPEINFAAIPAQQEAAAAYDAEPASKRARLEPNAPAAAAAQAGAAPSAAASDSIMQQVARYERRLWDRNSVLSVPGKSFARAAQLAKDALFQQPKRPEVLHSAGRSSPHRSQGPHPVIPIKPSGRLQRDTGPDTTLRDMGFNDVKIQTYGAAGASAAAAASAAIPAAVLPRPAPPAALTPMSASKQRPSSSSSHHPGSASKSRSSSSSSKRPDPRKGQSPIIIVPKGYETKLNMFNAQAFLEEGRFVTWQEAQEQGVKKAGQRSFRRTVGRAKPVTYHITDTSPAPRDPAWRRVVAVFVQGKEWQFKDWPFKGCATGDMVDTFSRMLGVHLIYANEQPPATVKSWNVRILKLHPNDRHGDMQLARDFYSYLDAMLGAMGSQLAY